MQSGHLSGACVGKSDPLILPWYANRMVGIKGQRVAFLGQTGHNALSSALLPRIATFHDIALKNWDINQEEPWEVPEVDAIVCTRSAYFSENPEMFIRKCISAVRPGGSVFIDWGLGDHWRSRTYMVGWQKEGERVSVVYDRERFLMSTFWMREFESHPEVRKFSDWISQKGYGSDITKIVNDEVPRVASGPHPKRYDMIALWHDSPQLYILTEFTRD